MREAIGGSMLYYILIPVIFLFIVFIAFIMNYASAYRASNYIITQIETCEANIANCSSLPDGKNSLEENLRTKYYYRNGVSYYCTDNSRGSVYKVSLNVNFELPLLGKVGVYKINSESKTIYGVSCSESTGMTFGGNL